jgi:hypothetical protein
MKHISKTKIIYLVLLLSLPSCQKWEDKPAKDLGLTNKYCNIPSAINYNFAFPGIEDNTTCIFPSTPFVGTYYFQDSIYDEADQLFPGSLLTLNVKAEDNFRFLMDGFCSNGNQLKFIADRFYRAAADSIIGQGTQFLCRNLDTLSGSLEYRAIDSSLYLDLKVISDTNIVFHRGRAYKK